MMRAFRSYIKICKTSGCGNYTRTPLVDYCASCETAMRKAEKQSVKNTQKLQQKIAASKNQEPRKKPKPVSEKQAIKLKEYNTRVEVWKKENPECQAKVSPQCTGETVDCHHKRGRGEYLMDETTWLPVCRSCHIWIGDNTTEAFRKNLSDSRLATKENQTI